MTTYYHGRRPNLAYHIVSGHSLKQISYLLCSLNLIYYGYRNNTWRKLYSHMDTLIKKETSPVRRDETY